MEKKIITIAAKKERFDRKTGKELKRFRVAAYCRVSTDNEEQLASFDSQVSYYTKMIEEKENWDLVKIYSDKAITGTATKNRKGFQEMIDDAINGKMDIILCKSISRFARNTLDTLKYIRLLRENYVEVWFEEENLHTNDEQCEMILTVLASVAQQEARITSEHVKAGLQHKMRKGEMIGFNGCLGYDYDAKTKSLSINDEEAEVVRYIFKRYLEGAGCNLIANELEEKGYKTKTGATKWWDSTVLGILKNEKYKGDLLLQKTFTVNALEKRRLTNKGEVDQIKVIGHHEPIVSEELFDSVEEMMKRRSIPNPVDNSGARTRWSRQHTFSSKLECGFCHRKLCRRSWHNSTPYVKVIWQCASAAKRRKVSCPESLTISEKTIENAFVASYSELLQNDSEMVSAFVEDMKKAMNTEFDHNEIDKLEKAIGRYEKSLSNLIDLKAEGRVSNDEYDLKREEYNNKLEILRDELEEMLNAESVKNLTLQRLEKFEKTLRENPAITEFDPNVFETVVDKVIVGGYDEDGSADPHQLTFIYKIGFANKKDSENYRIDNRRKKDKLLSKDSGDDSSLPALNPTGTC